MRSGIAIVLAAFLLAPGLAAAGVIHGRVVPVKKAGGPSKGVAWGITDAVIYVEKVPDQVERKLTRHGFWIFASRTPRLRHVIQQKRRFDPRVLAAAVGDRLGFCNLDAVYHQTFSVSVAKSFDLGKRLPGQCDTLSLDRPGVINLHCEIHPDMAAYVVVAPNHAFTLPDPEGRYRLPALPPGSYKIRVFHPRWGQIRRSVEVAKRGDTELDLPF